MESKYSVRHRIVGWLMFVALFAGMWAIFAVWAHGLLGNWTAAGLVSGAVILFFIQQIFFSRLFGGRGKTVWKVLDKVVDKSSPGAG